MEYTEKSKKHKIKLINPDIFLLGEYKYQNSKTKVRLFCRFCHNVFNFSLKEMERNNHPKCCGDLMMIAGNSKVDVHGLRSKGSIIDPVSEYRSQFATERTKTPIAS